MKKTFKNFNTFMVLVVCSAFGMILTSCEKENFDVNSQSSSSSSSTTQEIIIPLNDAKIIVSVSAIDGSTFKDIDATIRMNGEELTGLKTWTAPSIPQMTLYITAEASGYYPSNRKVVTPTINKGEFIYVPLVIYMRPQESTDPRQEEAEDLEEFYSVESDSEKPNELEEILEKVAEATTDSITVDMTAPSPKGTKLSEIDNYKKAVSCLTWDEPIIDYTKMFEPEQRGVIEDTTVKNAKDKLFAWADMNNKWQIEPALFKDMKVPTNLIDLDVKVKTHVRHYNSDVYVDFDVEGTPKKFGIKNALFEEVVSNELQIIAKIQTESGEVVTDTVPGSYKHEGSGGTSGN